MNKILLNNNWTMRRTDSEDKLPATVPGSVYSDLLDNGQMENPFWKDNEIEALKLMDFDYEYETSFDADESFLNADQTILRFDGLDTLADVYLNDAHIITANNMHRTWECDVKALLKKSGNTLKVIFHSPTKFIADAFAKEPTLGTEDCMQGFVHIRKAHCMFGWDWGAHLPDMGLWREVSLISYNTVRLNSISFTQHHDEKITLEINPEFEVLDESKDITIEYEVTAPDGTKTTYKGDDNKIEIDPETRWWPRGYGEQNLYTVTVNIYEGEDLVDSMSKRIGIRTITVDRTPDTWGEKFCVRVNGVNTFAMGADYIPEDHLLGRVTPETTRKLLEKAIFANFNSIRVWGGGYYPDDWFYDLCDEMGIIVWQDFMFACAVYDLTPEFEANIRAEFRDNIIRLRHHASLGLMCGNNEMEQFVKEGVWVSKPSEVEDYTMMYEQILPEMMSELAPQVFYWPASPSSGGGFDEPQDENRGDVHYWDVWHGNKPFSEYRKFHFRYLSEFGFQSFPSKKTVETFTDDERDMNIFSYVMERHQRNGAANGKIMNYMQQTYRYPTDFDTVIYASQLLQADAIRYGVEHFRRNRNDDRCMGAVYWQFNDCWPVASWSSVDYEGRLKALHYYARRFFAPVMISCEEEGMLGSGQELVRLPFEFNKSIRLCVSNETLEDKNVQINWQIRDSKANVLRSNSDTRKVPSQTSLWLDKVELPEIDIYNEYVSYQALNDGEIFSEGTVIFSLPKYFKYQNPNLRYEVDGNKITIHADTYAKSIEIRNENDDLILTDNFFDMNAGSKTVEVISGEITNLRLRSVYDIN
ncbi:MAG: glycoside hydrolase family 2 protein [Clostridiales bacterium]|nr:glycoside hydrolase family 2 protein [Clostridiales bacterium]